VNTGIEANDELCRIWQSLDRPLSEKEKEGVMQLVDTRSRAFQRAISQRNVGEYAAAVLVALVSAWLALVLRNPSARLGYAMMTGGALWVILFLWLMQRFVRPPSLESTGEVYREALLKWYDRQILLTRTAWLWYVLPLIIGQLIASIADDHVTGWFGFVRTGGVLALGVAIAILNLKAAKAQTAEKHELQRLLTEAE
jgi:hypothetical protein